MKFLTLVFSLLMASVAVADIGPVGSSTNLDGTGAVIGGTLEQRFINVKNQHTTVLTKGYVAVWDTSNDDGYSVKVSTTAGAYPACVMVKDCAAGKLCKCHTYGYNGTLTLSTDIGAATAGSKVFISEQDAGKVTGQNTVGVDDMPLGMFYDSTAVDDSTVEVFINIR
jgi:hypothetical protein